ncbi:tetratricopeptide repeat protein [Pseudonocardia parietis]|uniref:Tetratricopeptide (TPR) repeat protein n=1 Tax=Pseudonocardia parietis TaxID=570936 RepID=A0ABS4VRT6_9PSEU|nr:tetratricopeptide repeat protein [Pseudonocardia parietis]MBP2366642.1 tetratricopeptide (TPR) repeat protein [Pseudonocardia parietis]
MTVVRLLGPPRTTGVPPVRGRKPWALLALLLCATGPVPRCRAVELLFPGSDDPAAALRWTLSRARRATGGAIRITGDPLRAGPADGVTVDVLDVLAGRRPDRWPVTEATLPLLEGCEPDVPEFTAWLHGRRLDLARAGLRLQRSRRNVASSPAGRTAVRELVRVGEHVLDAGAARDGTAVLAGAARRARALGDDGVLAEALAHYGRGIVHAVASTDAGAVAALREADRLATRDGLAGVAALARRELGFVATATGDQAGAMAQLDRAEAAATGNVEQQAGVAYVRGFALVDGPGSASAVPELGRAVALAETADRPRAAAAALAMRARARLQRDEDEAAEADLVRARALVAEYDWTAMRPWVDQLHGELLLRAGRPAEAERVLTDALTLAEVLDDACWIALTSRGLAAARARLGDPAGAVTALRSSCAALVADPDVCCWIELHLRDTLCAVSAACDPASVAAESRVLAARAARTGLDEYVVRAARHRARLGDADAAREQRDRATRLANPALLRP